MNIFAISDLHLSFGTDKPMDIFGPAWQGYTERIKDNWGCIKENDVVLLPGDISWAMGIDEAEKDFLFLDGLPGRKIVGKGNHDFWWSSLKKIKEAFVTWGVTTVDILHNNAHAVGDYVICGTRGWKHPDSPDSTEQDKRIYERELNRLRLSLEAGRTGECNIICGLHYPPFGSGGEDTEFTGLLTEFNVKTCVYGHVHKNFGGPGIVEGMRNGVCYHLVSSDYLGFSPKKIVNGDG